MSTIKGVVLIAILIRVFTGECFGYTSMDALGTETDRLADVTRDGVYIFTEQGRVFRIPGNTSYFLSQIGRLSPGALIRRKAGGTLHFCQEIIYIGDIDIDVLGGECLPRESRGGKRIFQQQREEEESKKTQSMTATTNTSPTATQATVPVPPSSPWLYWSVRWEPKTIGIKADGEKVHCFRCTGPHWHLGYPEGANLWVFDSYSEAKEQMTWRCDCP